jgi:geranylgeranyl transferase type-1 subunit beta
MPKIQGSNAGFRTGLQTIISNEEKVPWDYASMASTYCALCILKICGDSLDRVNKPEISAMLQLVFNPSNGSFYAHIDALESDMRFVYCACAVAAMIEDFGSIDVNSVVGYIKSV